LEAKPISSLGITFGPIFNVLILVALVSLIAHFLRIPYTVGLIFGGLFAAIFQPFTLPQISTEVFLTILLPPVVFQAATKFGLSDMRKNGAIILSYAFVGTILSAAIIGVLAVLLLGFSLAEGLLLGAILAPTDAIAVIAVLKKIGVPTRLTLVVEGESLFNDGVAIVMYSAIVAAIMSGSGFFELTAFTVTLVGSIIVGVGVGLLVGYVSYRVVSHTPESFLQAILTFLAAYGSYQLAASLGGSGIISVVVSGLIIGNYVPKVIPQRSVEEIGVIWEFTAFIVTSISFILIGLDLNIFLFGQFFFVIVLSILTVLVARAVTVYSIAGILNLRGKILPTSWQHIINWSGLRGVVSVMLALGIGGLSISHAKEIEAVTFGVVFFSVIVQGTSIRSFAKRLLPRGEETTPDNLDVADKDSASCTENKALRSGEVGL
jgi:monovalent cation:H+ antiporter, CPA1 family